jgi:hypothetical protein
VLTPSDRQARAFRHSGPWLTRPAPAARWFDAVRIALRYQGKGVPLASLRSACGPESSKAALVTSLELTNHLLSTGRAVEVNVLAGGRLTGDGW